MKALDSSCAGGLADGCHLLAIQLIRQDGKGPASRDPARAKDLLERGCGLNHGPCCFNLAVMYKNGDEGVPRWEVRMDWAGRVGWLGWRVLVSFAFVFAFR